MKKNFYEEPKKHKKISTNCSLFATKKKGTRGITLIALVITIIVLLILAAVSIATLTGENGIITQAVKAKEKNIKGSEKEGIQLAIQDALTNETINNETMGLNPTELKEAIDKQGLLNNVQINGKRTGENEEYQYIISIENRKYGINQNYKVMELENGIYDQYIYVSEVSEELPIFYFNNTITQADVDEISGKKGESYTIEGICLTEDGEYQTAALEGKSGTLSIEGDINNANFSYKLTNFFQDDDVFYVKVKIGQEEKIQKLIIVQGDVVKYEENFAGIEYKGNWKEMESELCTNGKARYSEKTSEDVLFTCSGSGIVLGTIANSDAGKINCMLRDSDTNELIKLFPYDFHVSNNEIKYVKSNEIEGLPPRGMSSLGKTYKISATFRNAKHIVDGPDCKMIIDAIWIYK